MGAFSYMATHRISQRPVKPTHFGRGDWGMGITSSSRASRGYTKPCCVSDHSVRDDHQSPNALGHQRTRDSAFQATTTRTMRTCISFHQHSFMLYHLLTSSFLFALPSLATLLPPPPVQPQGGGGGECVTSTTICPRILVDTNCDGIVDNLDNTPGKHNWTATHGAIFLPNIGDSPFNATSRTEPAHRSAMTSLQRVTTPQETVCFRPPMQLLW
jgi:hypothetical protein